MSFFKWGRKAYYAAMTKAVDEWWNEVYKPSDFYDKIETPLTIHLCGSEAIIESKASEILGRKIDYNGTAGLAFIDKNKRAHIFVIAAGEVEFATTVINYFTAGHELAHIIDMINEAQGDRVVDYPDPDKFHK